MNCLVRLLWIYLNRCPESSTSTRKRLDPLLRTCITSSSRLYPPEVPLEPSTTIVHYTMMRQLEYGEELVTELLRGGVSGRDGAAELPYPDRATVVIRAVLCTLRNIELDRPAPWPQSADFNRFDFEASETSGAVLSLDTTLKPEVGEFVRCCGSAMLKLLLGCDKVLSALLLSNDGVTISAHASSSSVDGGTDQLTRKHGDIHVSYPARHQPVLRLFVAILDGLPRCLPPDGNRIQVANILCRATFSVDPAVCVAASDALRRMAQDPLCCSTLVYTYQQFVFETRHIYKDTFIGSRLLESQFERVIKLWLDLLQASVVQQRIGTLQSEQGVDQPPTQPANCALIDKIDACAIFLLCSTSLPLRRLAGEILTAARDLEDQLRRPSEAFRYSRIAADDTAISRAAQLYEGSWEEAEVTRIRELPWLTTSDRARLELATAKDKLKLVKRVAESEQSKDAALWISLLPFFMDRVTEQLPGVSQHLRGIVCGVVLRLQGHVAAVANASPHRAQSGLRQSPASTRSSGDTAFLADHWRSYLTILCKTMPTLHPIPGSPPIQRTKEAIILTPDTVDSPALLHYLISLLASDDPRFKDAAVHTLGSVGQPLLRPLSEILLGVVRRLADGSKFGGAPRETTRRPAVVSPVWTAIAHAFRLISPHILDAKSSSHQANLSSMIGFVKVIYTLLSDGAMKEDYDLQSLRRSFCVVVENLTNALGKLDASDRFFGEEMRGAIFKLCYEWCHVGRSPDIAKARESHTLQATADSYRGDRDRAQYLDDLQAKTKLLSVAAAEAMAGLCVSDRRRQIDLS